MSICDLRFTIYAAVLGLTGCAGGRLFQPHEVVTTQETVAHGQTNVVFSTNYVYTVNAGVTNALETARGIARETGGPWGGLAVLGLSAATAVLGAIARVKSNKAALLPTLITGIENAANNTEVKQTIQTLATAVGVEDRLNAEVRKITR